MMAAANAHLGYTQGSLAYTAVLVVGLAVTQALATFLLAIEEQGGSTEPKEHQHGTLLTAAVDALRRDLTFAVLCSAWLAMSLAGTTAVALAYWSRLRERAAMVNPPRHRLFHNSQRQPKIRIKS